MVGLQPRESCRDHFRSLGILTVVLIYILETIIYATGSSLARHYNVRSYNTRHNGNFNLPNHRTFLFSKKPSYAGAKLYNLLPSSLKEGSPQTLKRRLRCWLADTPLYSLDEFSEFARSHVNNNTI
uniref:Uncharacterized protein n=2 Tax=Graphocephala atropunctata TaxID=36148 RepID=A0A1B6LAS2_9HEMI